MEQDTNYHIQQLDKAYRNMKSKLVEQAEEICSLRSIVNAINSKNKDSRDNSTYYAWMPFEENYLDTLSCPVLIPAEWIRQIRDEAYKDGYQQCHNDNYCMGIKSK